MRRSPEKCTILAKTRVRFISAILVGATLLWIPAAHGQDSGASEPPPARSADAPPPTPFAIGGGWRMGMTAQFDGRIHLDADLSAATPGDTGSIRPQMQFAALYERSDAFRFFTAIKVNREVNVQEGPGSGHRELLLDLDEFYVRWAPFAEGVVMAGRSRMTDPRNWLFASSDDKNDNIQLQYRGTRDFFQVVVVARDFLPSNLFEPHSTYTSVNYAATFEHTFTRGLRAGGYLLLQDRRNEGDSVDRTYFGIRSRGTVWNQRIDYWADTSLLRGMTGPTPIRAYAFDVGALYKFPGAHLFHVVASYAYGSGDGNPTDGVDRRFRQTGTQENRFQYGGVSRFKYYGETLNPELSNLAVATAAVGFKPSSLSSVDLIYHRYALAHASNGLYAARLDRQPTSGSRRAGNAIDLVAGYRNRSAVEFEVFVGYFAPGAAFAPFRSDSFYGMFKFKYNFQPSRS